MDTQQEYKIFECECGSREFKVVVRKKVRDVMALEGEPWGEYTELLSHDERFIAVECAKCGKKIIQEFRKPPISKEDWCWWSEFLLDFIMNFEHYAVNNELADEDNYEAFLKGLAKGLWTLYNLIESRMVDHE